MQWMTADERRELGQARRKQVGRHDHAEPGKATKRRNPLALLERSMRGRVPALIPLKYQRMAASPFGFFRGAAPVMAADLAALPNTGIHAQLCGDAHVQNLGAFAAPDGRLVFDINDFDESMRGPFEWDLKRMATSILLAGQEAGDKPAACAKAARQCIERYAELMNQFASMAVLEVARYQVHRLNDVEPVHAALLKAQRATPLHSLESLTEPEDDKPRAARRFREEKPVLTRVKGAQAAAVLQSLTAYSATLAPQQQLFLSRFRPIDVAFKVVGTGSVGLRDYCVYLEGNGPADPLFLQIKEEVASAYAPYLTEFRTGAHLGHHAPQHNGQRVAQGQHYMQLTSDPFLGWTTIAGRDYLVRQLNDHKSSIEISDLGGDGLTEYGQLCGELLARGHARSGDACQIAGYVGGGSGFAEALAEFGQAYAAQTAKDWESLKKSAKGKSQTKTKAKAFSRMV